MHPIIHMRQWPESGQIEGPCSLSVSVLLSSLGRKKPATHLKCHKMLVKNIGVVGNITAIDISDRLGLTQMLENEGVIIAEKLKLT